MATAKELDLKPGELAVVLTTYKEIPRSRTEEMDIAWVGLPIDDPDATVVLKVVKVIDVKPANTDVEVLWSNATRGTVSGNDEVNRIGEIISIHKGFRNYFSSSDPRLIKEWNRANTGTEINIVPNRSTVSLTRGEHRYEEILPYK